MPQVRQNDQSVMPASEEQFREYADPSPPILWTIEPDGSCSFLSRGWYDYTGQDQDAGLGFGWVEVVHPDDRAEAQRAIIVASQQRGEFSLDCRLRRADGKYRWVMSAGRPRFDPAGEFAGFTGSVIDIHERKQAALTSALLSAIVDSSDDAIISKNLNGVIMSWNKSAERLFGYTAEEAIGQSIVMLIPPDRLDEEPKILERLKRGERVDHFETIRVRKDGTRLNISLTISPVKDSDGRIIGASKVARDFTDRVRQERALREANEALKRANADLQQFAYSASHDLQEPLRMVATYSELLQKRFGGQLGEAGDEYIGHTVRGAMRMETLLRDLRTYTQVSTAALEPPPEIDAGGALQKTLQGLEVAIRESGATVTTTELPKVRMYEFQLEQVFQNLIGNAIRYRGVAPPRIHVAAIRQDDEWQFSVQDNGIGIEPQFKEQIFGIFKRLHSVDAYPGTGMGLAICERAIERAGGRIWVESEPGRGSTFYLRSPATNTGEVAAQRDSHAWILLIEDSLADAGLVREALEEHGVQGDLVVIRDGDQATRYVEELEALPVACPSLVIIDLNLPRRSGHEVLRSIRQSIKCRNATVVILSSSDAREDLEESRELGASRHIRKPMRLEEFLELGAVFKQMIQQPE